MLLFGLSNHSEHWVCFPSAFIEELREGFLPWHEGSDNKITKCIKRATKKMQGIPLYMFILITHTDSG